ncbi:MAG TPA: hypothetical protein VG099_29240 [Gemmataceae bacterium]|nr:hypothetical protein [Gemmataceae bacterium]
MSSFPRRIMRLEKQHGLERRRAQPADRVAIYIPHNGRDDVRDTDACDTGGMGRVILYDPEIGIPQEG